MTRVWGSSRIFLFLFLIAGLIFSVTPTPLLAAETEPIKIGVIGSQSGWAGFIGTPQKEVFLATVADINKKGGLLGRPIELFIEDDQSVPTNAVIAATKLAKDKGVVAIIGPSTTDAAAAMINTIEQSEVPFFVQVPLGNPNKKWVFLVGPSDLACATHVLQYAVQTLQAKRIALLSDAAAYGTRGAAQINKDIKQYPGVSIVVQERIETSDTSVVPQLTKIKAAKPDVLIAYMTTPAATITAKNYKQLGMNIPVLGSNAISTPDFLKLAGKIPEESGWILFTQPFSVAEKMPADAPFRKNLYDPFKKFMKEAYGPSKEMNLFHTTAYDSMLAISEAIKTAGSDNRRAIRDALEKIRIEGFIGPFACTAESHQGSPVDPMIPVVVRNGEYTPYYHQQF
jgi:branched-chain amino acid transport system substrate-binding protein